MSVVDCSDCQLVKTLNDIFSKGQVDRNSTPIYWLVPAIEFRSCRHVLSKHPTQYTSSYPTSLALKQHN